MRAVEYPQQLYNSRSVQSLARGAIYKSARNKNEAIVIASDMRVVHSGVFGSGSTLDMKRNIILDTQVIKVNTIFLQFISYSLCVTLLHFWCIVRLLNPTVYCNFPERIFPCFVVLD